MDKFNRLTNTPLTPCASSPRIAYEIFIGYDFKLSKSRYNDL